MIERRISSMGRPPKILVVDDELRVSESLAYLLKTKGYEVTTANSGHDAMRLLADKTYELAILDVHLPDMMGTAIMDHVKVNSPDTTVIVITADADLDSALAALKCGAYDYLKKPFEFEELLNTVANAMNQQALKLEKDRINEKLYLSEKKYRYLVEYIPDIIYTLDAYGHFTFLSEAVEHLLGFSAKNLIGKHYTTIVCEKDRDRAQWFFDERRSRDRASAGIELRLKVIGDALPKNDGLPFLAVELKSMGIYEESTLPREKRYVGTHGVIRDISERKRLEAQLQNAERMESLGTLAGGIAHDFNNLLMGIQGRTSLLSMDLAGSPNMEHLQAIEQYILSAAELTKQLLGFARGGKYEVKPTDINELVLKSANMFGRTKKEIVIQTQFHNANIVVEVDRGQIDQVLLNLYVNAWQAMPEGGTLRLETECVVLGEKICKPYHLPTGRYVHLAISDTGIGMDAKTLQRIFDPFFTTKEKGRGTGLGLASAYGIIKNHGGIINAHSEIGYGTTFNIYLPLYEGSVANQMSSEEVIENGSETILLVDDEDMIIEVGQALLQRLGYQVIAAKSGKEAIDIVHHSAPHIDLVILDMVMPGLDGGKTFDVIRGIRPDMPVMLCSGYAINERTNHIMRKGCNGFIQKPFNASRISQKIRHVLDEGKAPLQH
jgi:two-component system cell cycle sensor histidine kinase/response regulator CckA